MNRKGITFWNIKDNRVNGQPISNPKDEKDVTWLRANLDVIGINLNELIKDLPAITAYLSVQHSRHWGSSHIEVIISRSETDEILFEVHRYDDPDQNNPSLTFGFDKPKSWHDPVQLLPICASGQTKEDVVLLGDLLLIEWPNCQRLQYRKLLP